MDATSGLQADFSSWVAATSDPETLTLHVAGFSYADLFDPARLGELCDHFDAYFRQADLTMFFRQFTA